MAETIGSDRDYLQAYINEKIAAAFLGCAVRTLQHWRIRGGGPAFFRKSKRYVRYRRQDLIAWAEGKLARSTSSAPPDRERPLSVDSSSRGRERPASNTV